MIIESMTISEPHRKGHQLREALMSLVGPIQIQPGCLDCRVYQSWPPQGALQLEARWESQNSLIGHLQSETYKKVLLLMELSATPPVLEFFTVVEFRGLDLVETARTPLN